VSTTRRALIASTAATAMVGLPTLRLAAETIDPAVLFGIQVDRARARAQAATDRVHAIEAAHPEPMGGQGAPPLDKSIPALMNVPAPDGEPIWREDLEKLSALSWPAVKAARLKWWDDTLVLMQRRAIETGYKAATDESERLWGEFSELASNFAEVEATSLAGVSAGSPMSSRSFGAAGIRRSNIPMSVRSSWGQLLTLSASRPGSRIDRLRPRAHVGAFFLPRPALTSGGFSCRWAEPPLAREHRRGPARFHQDVKDKGGRAINLVTHCRARGAIGPRLRGRIVA
jgi:hypothetical protein